MKDSQPSQKTSKKKFKRTHYFDTVIILAILNIALFTIVIFFVQKIQQKKITVLKETPLKVKSIPLPEDINSINASAAAYVVFDTTTRTVVAGKNKDLRFSPASTAKVMSATLALSYYNLEDYLKVPENIYQVEGSKMNLVPGEEVKVIDLLYGLLLPSGNDAAYTLSYYYKGGVTGFVNDMNRKAKELKLYNTHFVDPAGYEDGNYTTAENLARLGAIAMENKTFAQIVKTRNYTAYNRTFTHTFSLTNLNELLVFDNVLGIKTGFTNEAGGVLLTAIKKGDSVFIVCVLKSNDRFYDTRDLMQFIVDKVNFAVPQDQ